MRKLFYIIAVLFIFTSCQNDGYIGDLFGKWQLRTVEQAGAVGKCDTIFFSFQSEVFCTQFLINDIMSSFEYGKFTHQDGILTVKIHKEGSPIDSPKFQIFGTSSERQVGDKVIYITTEEFDVIKFTKKELILKSNFDDRLLTFRKY